MLNHFNFRKFKDKVLITNDFGSYAFLDNNTFKEFVTNKLDKTSDCYEALKHENFIIEKPNELFGDEMKEKLRGIKSYALSGTSLHIFAITNACNVNCVYCQAKDKSSSLTGFMSVETARKAVEVALQAPGDSLTFEIQGGEPLLNFNVVKEIIEHTNEVKGNKEILFTLVSNLVALDDEKLKYLVDHKVSVCTSLDGPKQVQENNRRCKVSGSTFDYATKGIKKLQENGICGGAIQTTTRYSLQYPEEIVNTYFEMGMHGIFIRALTPLGFAKADWETIGYSPQEFLEFYRRAFDRILEINRNGHCFPELHASYFLRKMLHGTAVNYMELRSPCGAGMGQLSYYYNGDVYTCDEGRMISEAGIDAFKLGNVYENSYDELMANPVCKTLAIASVVESLPGCSDCVYNPYCGVCPVVNYAHEKDIFPRSPKNFRCEVYSGMMNIYFDKLLNGDEQTLKIFESWIND